MTDDDYIHATWHMAALGGFAEALATAYQRADRDNKRKLREAFNDLFMRGLALYKEATETHHNWGEHSPQ